MTSSLDAALARENDAIARKVGARYEWVGQCRPHRLKPFRNCLQRCLT